MRDALMMLAGAFFLLAALFLLSAVYIEVLFMSVKIIRRKKEPHTYLVGSRVQVVDLRFPRTVCKEGSVGEVVQVMTAGGVRDERPRDDVYMVRFDAGVAYLYYGEIGDC